MLMELMSNKGAAPDLCLEALHIFMLSPAPHAAAAAAAAAAEPAAAAAEPAAATASPAAAPNGHGAHDARNPAPQAEQSEASPAAPHEEHPGVPLQEGGDTEMADAGLSNAQQQQQQGLEGRGSLAVVVLSALWVLLARLPAQRGQLTVRLLLKAAQAHHVSEQKQGTTPWRARPLSFCFGVQQHVCASLGSEQAR